MKLYETHSISDIHQESPVEAFTEYTSSASDASRTRTRLKKLGHVDIKTAEVIIDPTRAELIGFLNRRLAHATWCVAPTIEKLGG